LAHVADVFIRNGDIDTEIYRDARFIFNRFTAQLGDGTFKHLSVKIETKRIHMARLLSAEKISCPPQFEI
jgi:hypothetical protein